MITALLRRTVRTLYAFACGYCGVTEAKVGSTPTIDHFQPKEAGGTDDLDNLVYCCHACNLHKSAAWNLQTPPVLHPLRTDLSLHLRLLPDDTLEGLTPEGNRHIDTLHLNRQPMIERRKRNRIYALALEYAAQLPEQYRALEEQTQKRQRWIRLRGRRKR